MRNILFRVSSVVENTKTIGEKSEGMLLAKFLQKGWIVLIPFGDNQRYDFVIDRGNGFERVQVKTGRLRNGCIKFPARSSYGHRGAKHKSYQGQIDLFGVYCLDNEKIYLVPIGNLKSYGTLRIEEPKNNQKENIILAEKFLI